MLTHFRENTYTKFEVPMISHFQFFRCKQNGCSDTSDGHNKMALVEGGLHNNDSSYVKQLKTLKHKRKFTLL